MLDGDGLRGQQRLCEERAENNDVEVEKVFVDGAKKGKYEEIVNRE
jgi:hypothetical protein